MKQIRLKDLCLLNPLPNKRFQEKNGTFLPMEKVGVGSFSSELIFPYEQISSGYTFMQNNDVIRAIVTPCFENNKGTLLQGLENGFAFGSTEFMCLRPKKINSKFLYYITASEDFKIHALKSMKGVGGLRRINSKFALTYTVNNYSLPQQTAIANYLDHHVSKIDKEIFLLEQKVEKIDDYKQALIYETVTKGLDKNVPMKDSGIEWIGMIPKHWEVKRVKEIAKWQTGFTPDSKNEDYYDGNDDWITIGDMDGKFIKKSKTQINGSLFPSHWKTPANSLLFSFKLSIGQVAFNKEKVFTNEAICSFSPKSKINLNYFYYAAPIFISKNAKKNIYDADLLNQDLIANAKCLLIPKIEQQQIAEYLDEQCSKIDKKKELINKKVELLKEYKQSLIYEAVTGKINVGE